MPLKAREPIAIVRLDDLSEATSIGEALLAGGIGTFEFALTNERAIEAVGEVVDRLGEEALVGAGTVLDAQSADAAIGAGAQFLVTPVYVRDVIDAGREAGVPVVCGAFSPTEIFAARRAGADLVKVFPARNLGPAFFGDVLAPLPDLKLVPTGGVGLENCAEFIRAGAYTVAVGGSLVDGRLIRDRDWKGLSEKARRFVEACDRA
jgi:2-dehydro-3-deoxyphosphogluconate aldolase/(4S)-4-hydroxy-2-oxoglutarate aldolase